MNLCNILSILLFFSFFRNCEDENTINECNYYFDQKHNMNIYTKADLAPSFPKGITYILEDFIDSFKLIEEENFQGTYTFVLILDQKGNVLDIGIKNKLFEDLTKYEIETIKIIRKHKTWIPAKCGNKHVPYKLNIPIRI